MGESELTVHFGSEDELTEFAGLLSQRWRTRAAGVRVVGLKGELGGGKTTFARALLRGLGYRARVPSPTYTLLEHYALPNLDVVHLDLYRLAHEQELEALGVRDWLAGAGPIWVLVEWPERAARLESICDLSVHFRAPDAASRRLRFSGRTPAGIEMLRDVHELSSSYAR
jgi:tRNA threonylcarbamoyladenosine biosynthesis protein TsaE